jgi:hypothetical protein
MEYAGRSRAPAYVIISWRKDLMLVSYYCKVLLVLHRVWHVLALRGEEPVVNGVNNITHNK